MISSKRQGHAGLLLELLVIVLGVLIALGADSWWQDHEDSQRETSYLISIATDMDEAARILDSAMSTNAGYMARADTVLSILSGEEELPAGVADVRSMMTMLMDFPGLPTGTLRAFLTTGELRLLQSEELRSLLIREHAVIEAQMKWIDEVASQAGPNVQALIHTLAQLAPSSAPSSDAATLDALRREPQLAAQYRIYLMQLANVVDSQRLATESVGNIRRAVSTVPSN